MNKKISNNTINQAEEVKDVSKKDVKMGKIVKVKR